MIFDAEEQSPQAKAFERLEKQKEKQLKTAISKVGQTEEGRFLLWHIIFDICKMNEDAFGGEEVVYRHMGRRSAGIQLLAEVEKADIAIHLNMIKDNKNRSESELLIINQLIEEEKLKGEQNV